MSAADVVVLTSIIRNREPPTELLDTKKMAGVEATSTT
jgi:hypothetical protein